MVNHFLGIGRCESIEIFARSGRNVIFIAHLAQGERVLVKQSLRLQECNAYLKFENLPFLIKPRFCAPRLGVVGLPYFSEARDLEYASKKDFLLALQLLLQLGVATFALDLIQPWQGLRTVQEIVDYPLPRLGQITDTSRGFRAALHLIQSRGLMMRCGGDRLAPLTVAHGDIKLDNIIVVDGAARLIDFDMVGTAPFGSNVAAFIGAMFVATIRAGLSSQETVRRSANFRTAFRAARELVQQFKVFSRAHHFPILTDGLLTELIVRYLFGRCLSESIMKEAPEDSDLVMIELASSLLDHGFEALANIS